MKKILRKYILAFVSCAMLISGVQAKHNHVHAQDKQSTTDAKIIVDNYNLTSKERSILLHSTINAKTYDYSKPLDKDADTLINVDADNFIVYAESYKDAYGNTWTPKKVIINEDDKTKEYSMSNGKADFKATGDNYSVEVEYNLYIPLDRDTQLRLLNTPYWLTNGIDALDTLYGVSNDLKSVADYYMPQLIKLRDGVDTPFGLTITDPNYISAVTDLENQLKKNKNSTKYFDLNEEIKIYEPYSGVNDQEYYFSNHAVKLKEEAERMKTNLSYIAYSKGFDTVITFGNMFDEYKDLVIIVKTMVNYLETLVEDLEYVLAQGNWEGMNHQLLSDVEGDTGIVDLVSKRGTVDDHSNDKIKDELFVDSKTLKCTINRNRVNVIVQAYVIDGKDSEELTLLEAEPIEIALKHEMSASDVHNAIKNKGIEDKILKEWAEKYQVCEDYYVRTTSDIKDKLVEDITYTITYMPKKYDVVYSDNGDKQMNVYYGYQLTLPKASSGFSYEYTINETKYRENDVYRIVDNTTIDRIIGKEKVVNRLLNILAKDSTYDFDDLAKAILTNEAVFSDMVEYRIVEEMDVNTVIDYDNDNKHYVLTVNSYPSGIDGMEWEPVAFTVVKGGKETGSKMSITDHKATFKTDYLDGVNVYYELAITKTENIRPTHVTNSYLLNLINLPSKLLEDSKAQIESLDYLASLAKPGGYLTMGSTIYSALGMIKSNYEDKYGKDTSLYPPEILKEYEALIELRDNCFNHSKGSQLYVYEYVLKYMSKSMNEDASELGLIAYYSDEYGYEQYQRQLDLLVKNLNTVKNSEEFNLLLTGQLAPYKDKVEKLIDVLDDLVLVPPSKHIDAKHPSAGKLFDLLDDKKSCKGYEAASGLTDYASVQKPLEGKVSVILNAFVDGVKYNSTSLVFDVNAVLTQNDINKMKSAYEELYADLNIKHYTKVEPANLPKAGTRLTENLYVNENWTPTFYKIFIQDENTGSKQYLQSVTYTDTVIMLDKPILGYRYDYTILDEVRSAETTGISYTITTDNFDKLFESGELVIKRRTVNIAREKLTNMFNKLNEPFKNLNSGFVLTHGERGYNAVLRIDPSEKEQVQKLMVSVLSKMNEVNYGYIAIGDKDNALWNASTAEISLEAYVNALLSSGFSSEDMINAIDNDGKIINNAVAVIGKKHEVIVGESSDVNKLGGYLYYTDLYLGTTSEDTAYFKVNFVVTVADFGNQTSLLKQIRTNLINSQKYHSFNTTNGKLNLMNTLSDDVYSLIVSAMVLSGEIEFDDVKDLTFKDVMNFFKRYQDMFKDELLTATTLQKTFDKLGLNVDLSDREELLNTLLELNRTHSFVMNDDMSGNMKYDLTDMFDELGISAETKALFKEHEIVVPTTMTLTNLDDDYEAVVFNPYQNYPVKFIKVLEDVHFENSDNSIILLKDIEHDLVLDHVSTLDLNGFKVKGNIDSKKELVILDSQNTGSVTGSLSKNIQLTGGSYKVSNLESYVKEGYKVVEGRVLPKYYSINKSDNQIVVEVDPQLFYDGQDYLDVVMNIIVSLNDYTKAHVKMNGHDIYLNSYKTVNEMMSNSNKDTLIHNVLDELDVESLFNDLVKAFKDYENIVDSGKIAEFTMDTYAYVFDLELNNDEISGNIKTSEDVVSKEVIIQFKENKSYENTLNVFKDIVDFEFEDIKVNDINYSDKLNSDLDDVKVNINVNNDVKYTLMLGVILSYGTNNEKLIDAMTSYIANDTKRENLKMNLLNAIHDLSTKEFVDAFKKVSEMNVSFTDMCNKLGFGDFNQAAGKENNLNEHLDSVLKDYVDYVNNQFKLFNVTGDSTLLKTNYVLNDVGEYKEVNISLNLIADLPCTHKSSSEVLGAEATCDQDGVIEIRCDECNEVLSTKAIPAKGHGELYLANQKDATCEEDGYTGDMMCPECQQVVTPGEVIEATGHEIVIKNAVDATCTNEGYTGDSVCGKCSKFIALGSAVEKIDHDYINGVCDICKHKDPNYKFTIVGDVSGDNKVNALDYIKIKNHIMGTKRLSEDELNRADVSGDNKITSLDYIKIKNHIMGTKRLY